MALEGEINDVLEVVFSKGFDAGRDVGSRRYELFELFNKGTDKDTTLALIKEETVKELKNAQSLPSGYDDTDVYLMERIAQLQAELEEV